MTIKNPAPGQLDVGPWKKSRRDHREGRKLVANAGSRTALSFDHAVRLLALRHKSFLHSTEWWRPSPQAGFRKRETVTLENLGR
jgi:hypothetical protein